MPSPTLLESIADFCRRCGVAESNFGRRAVNDGKLVSRLSAYLRSQGGEAAPTAPPELLSLVRATDPPVRAAATTADSEPPGRNFRFFDNRLQYLLFVTTCSGKDVVARRVGLELGHIHPRPPALRLFDAGMGDGTVLTSVMRQMHRRFATMPFYIVGKEIILEDVRLVAAQDGRSTFRASATVLVVTNMYYAEAPWLAPRSLPAATSMVWNDSVERLAGEQGLGGCMR